MGNLGCVTFIKSGWPARESVPGSSLVCGPGRKKIENVAGVAHWLSVDL